MATVLARRRATPAVTPERPRGRPAATHAAPITHEELVKAASRDLVDYSWISEHTGVARRSLSIYLGRGAMPKPDLYKCGGPLWWRETIEEWERERNKRADKGVK